MKNIVAIFILFLSLSLMPLAANGANKSSQSPQKMSVTQQAQVKPQRSSSHDADVWLHRLDLSLYQDLDQDGFNQNLRLNLDLDTSLAQRDVQLQVWLKAPEGRTELVFESRAMLLIGDAYSDAQQIDIQFVDEYVEDYYSIELVVIDPHSKQKIFYVNEYEDEQLRSLAIEGQSSDQSQTISVYSADIDLYNDDNQNGFYHQLSVEFDVDVPYGHAHLIAEFYLDGQLIHTSERFSIYGSATSDKQSFDIEVVAGLQPNYYDLDIHILDADERYQRHHIAAIDWVVFSHLPLESYYWDHYSDDDIEVHIDQHGGGIGFIVLMLALLGCWRVKDA